MKKKPIILDNRINLRYLSFLVVDRDSSCLQKTKEELELLGAQVFVTPKISSARDIVFHNYIHAVLCDIGVGGPVLVLAEKFGRVFRGTRRCPDDGQAQKGEKGAETL